MATDRLRRARGTGTNTAPLFAHIDPAAKAHLDDLAAQLNAPKWAVIEALLRNVQLDEAGRPVWWREVMPEPEEDLFQQAG